MKCFSLLLASIAVLLSFSGEALAHKVNVFAFIDGDEIQVECSFSRSQKVRNGKLIITDLETGDVVHEGVTDERGLFRFRPPDAFLATGHGLNIRLLAGEGHRDDWKVTPEELRSLSMDSRSKPASRTQTTWKTAQPEKAENSGEAKKAGQLTGMDTADLEVAIGRVLDEKLFSVKQALARQQKDEPGLRDIVGGIGWILGLLGLATYMKHRHRT
ncbi:MAG: hypothetical protein LBJ46_02030 [Planctomycetota bacterium]|nr:hypothetical protein [Planctomycetota bacterium]